MYMYRYTILVCCIKTLSIQLLFLSELWFFGTDLISGLDPDINPDEEEEKQRLISQVLELQNTLDGLFAKFWLQLVGNIIKTSHQC